MALSADRNTPFEDGELVSAPVAASTKCYAGGIAVANANGYAAPGSTATGLTYLGRFEETVDNSSGQNGGKVIQIRRKKAFKWKNSGTDAVTQASLGKTCYIVDDETVAATNGTNTRSAAGIVVGIDSDGVWVQ
ncbi:hypothetical protein [Desulfocurvibacter africanus]|uniref:hypothetical protein n=1 Tax=Desulfocurvibacter africanus TaxID=873 RepID=UPI00041C4685|nr:hypothetical protein [Desulfocurvibacter africanus]